jgi:flagellar assembly protein FliH
MSAIQNPDTPAAGALSADGPILQNVLLEKLPRHLTRPGSAPTRMRATEPLSGASLDQAETDTDGFTKGLREGREKGYAEGHSVGALEGHREGLEIGRARGERDARLDIERRAHEEQDDRRRSLMRFDELLVSLSAQLRTRVKTRSEDVEGDVVAVCHLAVCRLLGDHAMRDTNVLAMVRQAIELYISEGDTEAMNIVSVHVHPEDIALLTTDAELKEWLERMGARGLQWQSDASVRLGGCIVRGKGSSVDARLETQIDSLHQIFKQERRRQNTSKEVERLTT